MRGKTTLIDESLARVGDERRAALERRRRTVLPVPSPGVTPRLTTRTAGAPLDVTDDPAASLVDKARGWREQARVR